MDDEEGAPIKQGAPTNGSTHLKTVYRICTLRRQEGGSLGIAIDIDQRTINTVHPGGVGEQAGLLEGDVITEVNGKDTGTSSFATVLPKAAHAPIRFKVKRIVHVASDSAATETGGVAGDSMLIDTEEPQLQPKAPRKTATTLSLTISGAQRQEKGTLGIAIDADQRTINTVHPGGVGEQAGLLEGDVITEVNGKNTGTSSFTYVLPPRGSNVDIKLKVRRTLNAAVEVQTGGGAADVADEQSRAEGAEDAPSAEEITTARARNCLADHSATEDPADAEKLYVGRLVAHACADDDEDEFALGIVAGVAELRFAGDKLRFRVDYPHTDSELVNFETLLPLVIPFSDMTEDQLNANDLPSSTLRAELQARGVAFHHKLGKKRLAALLFEVLAKARELAHKQATIAVALDDGEVSSDKAKALSDAVHDVAIEEEEGDTVTGAAPPADAMKSMCASESSELSQMALLVRDYNAKQVGELSTLMGVVHAATSRLKAIRELLEGACASGLVVTCVHGSRPPGFWVMHSLSFPCHGLRPRRARHALHTHAHPLYTHMAYDPGEHTRACPLYMCMPSIHTHALPSDGGRASPPVGRPPSPCAYMYMSQ